MKLVLRKGFPFAGDMAQGEDRLIFTYPLFNTMMGVNVFCRYSENKKALQAKKKPEGLHPVCLTLLCIFVCHKLCNTAEKQHSVKAGLLTLGSTNVLRLPIRFILPLTVAYADIVPDHSGGTAPDFHGIPY